MKNQKYKEVTIKISNKELNALEDFVMVEFHTEEERKKSRDLALTVWGKLVIAFEKKNK